MTDSYLDPNQDWEALYNMRQWLIEAVEAKGAKMTGGGCGCGQADIDITLEGYPYNIRIKPRNITTKGS